MIVILEGILWFLRFAAGAGIFIFLDTAVCYPAAPKHAAAGGIGGAAFVFCCAFYGFGGYGLISLKGLLAFIYLGVLTAAAWTDWNVRRIYDRSHIYIFLLGIAAIWLFPERTLTERLIGILIVSFPMLFMAVLIDGAFGGGDIKLMAASGFLLGWRAMVPALFLGIFTGGIYCIWMMAAKKMGRKDSFAFGPFLAIGLAAAFFYGDTMLDWYCLTKL